MAGRVYMSNISKLWPLDRQKAILKAIPGFAQIPVYQDNLTRRGLQARSPDLLEERATMLRPTSRRAAETIYVASPAVLVFGASDLAHVLTAAAARHATLVFVADGLEVPPDPHTAVVAQVIDLWERHKRRALSEGGRLTGIRVAQERRAAATAAGLDKVRADWSRPSDEAPTAELVARSGLTYKSLNQHLGPRKKAQRAAMLREIRLLKKTECE
jgi:hypothetical protein